MIGLAVLIVLSQTGGGSAPQPKGGGSVPTPTAGGTAPSQAGVLAPIPGGSVQEIEYKAPLAGLGLRITPAELPPSRTRLVLDWADSAPIVGEVIEPDVQLRPLSGNGVSRTLTLNGPSSLALGQSLGVVTDPFGGRVIGSGRVVQLDRQSAVIALDSDALAAGAARQFVAFSPTNSTEHLEIVWDPSEARPLPRTVFLKRGRWRVSLSSIPIPFERQPYSNAAWSALTAKEDAGTNPTQLCTHYRVSAIGGYPANCEPKDGWRTAELTVETNVGKADPNTLLIEFGSEGEVDTPLGSVPRAFGAEVAERLAGDALQAIADVAVVRAQQVSLDAAKKLIVNKVCGATDPPDQESWAGKLSARLEKQTDIKLRIFPQSCDLLRNANASALASLGASIRAALIADATDMLTTFISAQVTNCFDEVPRGVCNGLKNHKLFVAIAAPIGTVSGVVAAAVFDSEAALPRAQAFVTTLARGQNTADANKELKTAMAILAYCHKGGSCDSHGLRSLLEAPKRVLLDGTPIKHELGDYVALVAHGLAVMHPKKGDDSKTHVLNSLRFARGVARVIAKSGPCKEDPSCRETAGQIAEVLDLLFAAAERDPVRLVAMATVAVAKFAGIKRSGEGPKILTALATYADSYGQSASLTPEQARQRRAESVAALADIAKERELRVGDIAVGFGTWIGPRGGIQDYTTQKGVAAFFHPSIPVGLFLDLRRTKDDGFWAAVSIADAGGYATIATPNLLPASDPDMRTEEQKKAATDAAKVPSTPSVAAAFQPGVAIGWSLWDLAFTIDLRFHPWQTGTPRPAFSAGISASFVIPLIWLR